MRDRSATRARCGCLTINTLAVQKRQGIADLLPLGCLMDLHDLYRRVREIFLHHRKVDLSLARRFMIVEPLGIMQMNADERGGIALQQPFVRAYPQGLKGRGVAGIMPVTEGSATKLVEDDPDFFLIRHLLQIKAVFYPQGNAESFSPPAQSLQAEKHGVQMRSPVAAAFLLLSGEERLALIVPPPGCGRSPRPPDPVPSCLARKERNNPHSLVQG
jgi:hypothetical protein